jgi:hypothetical protein
MSAGDRPVRVLSGRKSDGNATRFMRAGMVVPSRTPVDRSIAEGPQMRIEIRRRV